MSGEPLAGRTVVVTRPREQAPPLSDALRELGADVLEYPTIAIRPPDDPAPLQGAVERLDSYDWIVFTSVNGVRSVYEELERRGGEPAALGAARLAAIGPSTADALEHQGLEVEVVPGEYRAEALVEALDRAGAAQEGVRILLPRAAEARDVLPDELRSRGAEVDEVAAYATLPGRPGDVELEERMRRGEIDWLTFTASSTVRNFVRMAGQDVGRSSVACIGPITAGTARDLGVPVDVVAEEYTIPGLVRALAEAEAGRSGDPA